MTEIHPVLTSTSARCKCVRVHAPAGYVTNLHHVIPQSWGGPTVAANLEPLCPNSHTATHRLIDEYVKADARPPASVLRAYNPLVRRLAARAWASRPPKPTRTSLTHEHGEIHA